MSLVELAVVLAVVSVLIATTLPAFRGWTANFNLKDAARSISDSLALARAEAIRTGNNHIVAINWTLNATSPVEVANDGEPALEIHMRSPCSPTVVDQHGHTRTVQAVWRILYNGRSRSAVYVRFAKDRSRNELPTTLIELSAMAASAISGCRILRCGAIGRRGSKRRGQQNQAGQGRYETDPHGNPRHQCRAVRTRQS